MPPRTDDSDHPSTLPLPELNPMLNPLLAQNMGRWAEVYFTSAPERREQAVRDLLRELQAQQATQENSVHAPKEGPPVRQASVSSHAVEAPPTQPRSRMQSESARARGGREPSSSGWSWRSALSPRMYRIYAGAALVIVVLALATMLWRGGQTPGGLPASAPPAVQRSAESARSAVPAKTASSPQSSATSNQTDVARTAAEAASAGRGQAALNPAPAGTPATTNPPTQALPASGSQELSVAKDYLNGTGGKEQDTQQAISWLWKAVAKQNPEATELLSDLYLKGEGVQKNCEQARVLLVAAASRGRESAAERLKNLQPFGCE